MLRIVMKSIQFYQRWISSCGVPRCRFIPTCSNYCLEAIQAHGYYGMWLGLKRLLRCHPWGKHGLDEVPSPLKSKVGKNG